MATGHCVVAFQGTQHAAKKLSFCAIDINKAAFSAGECSIRGKEEFLVFFVAYFVDPWHHALASGDDQAMM